VALNFDAKLTLDVSEFLASVKKAENAIDALRKKIATPMSMPGGKGIPSGIPGRQAASNDEPGRRMADDAEKNSARARYALYDVAAAYQQVQQIGTAALKAMIGTATEYERAFVNVARTTDFVSIKIGEASRSMQYSLTQLAEEIPVSFGKITEIATIGNQLGIAQGELVGFTKTVSQFSTITGISVDQAALSFGRIGELLAKTGESTDFNALGSSIAYAGVKAVATETQILSVTKEIATTAKMAKFTTAETVGLATALSSLGIAPEAARGSIIRTFALINQAVGQGGEKLKAYAGVAGKSSEQFAADWTKNGQVAFDSFLSGLQSMSDNGQNLDTVLRNLGVQNVRDIQTVQKLGDNYDVYFESIKNANKGFEEATFLAAAYGQVQDTVAAKIEIVQNKFNNFLASTGEISFPGVKILLDFISSLIDQLNSFARNPFGKVIIGFTTVALALATAIAAINAVVFIAKATMMAYAVAMESTAISSTAAAASTAAVGAAAEGTAIKVSAATVALKAFQVAGKATLWIAGLYAAIKVIDRVGDAFQHATDASSYFARKAEESLNGFAGMQDALSSDYASALASYGSDAAVSAAIASGEIVGLTASIQTNSEEAKRAQEVANGYSVILGGSLTDSVTNATDALEKQNIILGANYDAWVRSQMLQSGSFKDLAMDTSLVNSLNAVGFSFQGANEAAKKGEASLNSYYSNLIKNARIAGKNVDAFNIEQALGGDEMLDGFYSVDSALNKFNNTLIGSVAQAFLLGNAATEAATGIEKLATAPEKFIESTKTLEKARTIWDYIAEVQTKLKTAFDWRYASKNAADNLYTAWKKVATSFKDAEKAVRELKTSMLGLVSDRSILEYQLSIALKYGDTLRANAIQAELNANADKMAENKTKQEQATQDASRALKGNSDAAIKNRQTMQGLVQSSLEYLTQLKTTSKDTTALINSAKGLKSDFISQGVAMGFSADQLGVYSKSFDDFIKIIANTSDKIDLSMTAYMKFDGADAALHKWKKANESLTIKVKVENPDWLAYQAGISAEELQQYQTAKQAIKDGTKNPMAPMKSWANIVKDFETKFGKGFASGGLVSGPGTGTSDGVRANLSNGEYVVKASAVSRVGVGFLNALNNQQGLTMPARSVSPSSTASGSNVVYLSPDDRALLRAAIDRPVNLYTENTRIAQSANDGNVLLAQRGRN
jgi:TP901 family phage tail tape measure protein